MNLRTRMLLRLLLRSFLVRRGSSLAALATVVAACAVGTAMLNLSLDARAKLQSEFRSFGANAIALPEEGAAISPELLTALETQVGDRGIVSPTIYAVATTPQGAPVVIAGVDFEKVRRLNSWWSVTAWPADASSGTIPALVGHRAASSLGIATAPVVLKFAERERTLASAGRLTTGGPEDSRVYVDRELLAEWTGVGPASAEISLSGSPEQVTTAIAQLDSLDGVSVRPLRQITEAEAGVLGKAEKAFSTTVLLIIVISFLCVLATLGSSVLERRKDFAVMKALGASQATVRLVFASEAALLAIAGALLGYVIGVLLAMWIGRANLEMTVVPRFQLFPAVVAVSLAVCLLSALFPMRILNAVQPSVMLKGE